MRKVGGEFGGTRRQNALARYSEGEWSGRTGVVAEFEKLEARMQWGELDRSAGV